MSQVIHNLHHARSILQASGYTITDLEEEQGIGGSFAVALGGDRSPVVAILTSHGDWLDITCALGAIDCTFGREQDIEFASKALILNSQIKPYAVAIVASADPDTNWPVVITDCLSMGKATDEELMGSLDELMIAFMACKDLIKDEALVPA